MADMTLISLRIMTPADLVMVMMVRLSQMQESNFPLAQRIVHLFPKEVKVMNSDLYSEPVALDQTMSITLKQPRKSMSRN